MGTWGYGNFDSDAACNLRDEELRRLWADIQSSFESGAFRVEDLDILMAALAMYTAILKHCGGEPPEPQAVRAWLDQVLRVFDEKIEGLDPTGPFRQPRREIIRQTFAELLASAETASA